MDAPIVDLIKQLQRANALLLSETDLQKIIAYWYALEDGETPDSLSDGKSDGCATWCSTVASQTGVQAMSRMGLKLWRLADASVKIDKENAEAALDPPRLEDLHERLATPLASPLPCICPVKTTAASVDRTRFESSPPVGPCAHDCSRGR